MDELSQSQVESIKKLSTSRLITKLSRVGYSEEDIEKMDREMMLETWAQCVAQGLDRPPGEVAKQTAVGYDVELERQKLEFEIRKFDAEQRMREAELKQQQQLKETELQQQQQLKEAELKLTAEKYAREQAEKESIVFKAKRFGDAIKASVTQMGQDALSVVLFFKHIEAVFDRFQVPDNLKAALIQPYLNSKSRSVVSRMDPSACNDYKSVRDVILREHKLSPCAYLDIFNKLSRESGETTVMYGARLKSILSMYLESRQVKSIEELVSLIVSDRIKSTVSEGCLRYILSVEATTTTGWMRDTQLAECIDLYTSNHFNNDKPRAGAINDRSARPPGGERQTGAPGMARLTHAPLPDPRPTTDRPVPATRISGQEKAGTQTNARQNIICYKCLQPGHTRKQCPKNTQAFERRVNTCTTHPTNVLEQSSNGESFMKPPSKNKFCQTETVTTTSNECRMITDDESVCSVTAMNDDVVPGTKVMPYGADQDVYRDFVSLHYVNVNVEELDSENSVSHIKALEDSGSELSVIKSSLVQSFGLPKLGSVCLRGIVGNPISADLVKLHVSLADDQNNKIPVVCAVCPDLNEDMILTTALVRRLLDVRVNTTQVDDDVQDIHDEDDTTDDSVDCADKSAASSTFLNEQQCDETLRPCWEKAQREGGDFVIKNHLLYHVEKIESVDEKVVQLCLPASRRKDVMELAHCTVGCHQAYRRTRDRIKLSFYWPSLVKDVQAYCSSCEVCQKTSRLTVWDRTPITAVPRAQYAFQEFYVDCAGPLFPNQKTSAYQYFIVLCDSATAFPFALPLRALTAKNIADALVKTWTLTGVPETVIWDNASPHKSELMRELMKRMGCSPRFSTPFHPQGHSAAERLIGTLKTLISKTAADHPKQWHHHLDFILWAVRESVNESLGVAPWTLVFSRLPRGPLSVLKESWENAVDEPHRLGKSTVDYMRELLTKLHTAHSYAEQHGAQAQQNYVSRYNRRAREKQFAVGDSVLLLAPDSTSSRVFRRWQGPARVIEVRSPHSYIIELNGVRQHVHANRLKRFLFSSDSVTCSPDFETVCVIDAGEYNRGSDLEDGVAGSESTSCFGCAVINDDDGEWGEIHTFTKSPDKEILLPSEKIDPQQIAHLSTEQQHRLLAVLDKYHECFSDDPGLCTLVQHEINLLPDFRPKRLKAYRVPERLKPQVSQEIQHLLDLGVIRPSSSDMVSPLVVVLKGPGGRDGIRLAVDYSYVNRFCRNDPFPVPEIDCIVNRIANGKLYSSFDASQGYFQTKIRPGDEPLTAFVCDDGVFEFLRTPFGGKSCGSTFIRAVQKIVQPIKSFTESYVDDLTVHTHPGKDDDVFSLHLEQIDRFLRRIKETGLTLKLRKCKFCLPEIKFCGKIIGSGGRRPDPDKVAPIQNLEPAKTKKEVRRILGLFGYFRDHIPNYAAIARPLTDLTGKRIPNRVPWTDVHSQALTELKQALINATNKRLSVPDFNRPFNIHVDASDSTVAGYLGQVNNDGVECPLAFFSVKLKDSQKHWATVHKEAFAVMAALKKFRNWIFGAEIQIFSDHNPITYLTESSPKNAKLMRWCLGLMEFNIKFHYTRGKNNIVPDSLTRLNSGE